MHEAMYDKTEPTYARFVGFIGNHGRYDLVILTTDQFYGKKLVTSITAGRSAILNQEDIQNIAYLMEAFAFHTEEEAEEFAFFLEDNL